MKNNKLWKFSTLVLSAVLMVLPSLEVQAQSTVALFKAELAQKIGQKSPNQAAARRVLAIQDQLIAAPPGTLNAVVEQLLESGDVSPRDVAAALAASGQTQSEIEAILTAANVEGARSLARTAEGYAQTYLGTTSEVVEITGNGLLVGANGRAVIIRSPIHQLLLATAFVRLNPETLANAMSRGALASNLARMIALRNPAMTAEQIAALARNLEQRLPSGQEITDENYNDLLNNAMRLATNDLPGGNNLNVPGIGDDDDEIIDIIDPTPVPTPIPTPVPYGA